MPEKTRRTQVREAVEKLKALGKENANRLFTWNGNMGDTILSQTEALHFKNIVNVITLPLVFNDVLKLTNSFPQEYEQSSSTSVRNIGSHISASQITLIPAVGGTTQQQLLQNVTYKAIESMLDIRFDYMEFNIEAKIDGLVICQAGQSYKSVLNTQEGIGKFGTIFLQIPMEEDRPCGKIVIYDGTAETSVKFENNKGCSAAAIAGDISFDRQGSYEIQSADGEVTVVMICSLVWNDYLTFRDMLPAGCFPELLILTNKIKAALMPWIDCDSNDSSQLLDGERRVTPLGVLCLPTSGRKEIFKLFCFSLEDMIVVESLKHVSFIDVHLANIEPYLRGNFGDNKQHSSPFFPNANEKLGSWFGIKKGSRSEIHNVFSAKVKKPYDIMKFGQNRSAAGTPVGAAFGLGANTTSHPTSQATSQTKSKVVHRKVARTATSGNQGFTPVTTSHTPAFHSGGTNRISGLFGQSEQSQTPLFGAKPFFGAATSTVSGLDQQQNQQPAGVFGQAVTLFGTSTTPLSGALTTTSQSFTPTFGSPQIRTSQFKFSTAQQRTIVSAAPTAAFGATTSNAGFTFGCQTTTSTTSVTSATVAGSHSAAFPDFGRATQSITPPIFKGFGGSVTCAAQAQAKTIASSANSDSNVKEESDQWKAGVVAAHDIFDFHFSTDDYLISDITPCETTIFGAIPVILIQSRSSHILNVGTTFREELLPEDLLESLEERLVKCTVKSATENSPIHCSLLKDLQQIIKLLEKDSQYSATLACKRCFFSRLFNVCVRLRGKDEALEILKQVLGSCQSVKQWFACADNACRPNALDPAASFAHFIDFTNGWETCPDVIKQLMSQLISEESFHILSDIGLNLLRIGYVTGAQETLGFILKSIAKFKSHEMGKIFNVRLVVLAIHLHRDESRGNNVIDAVFDVVKHLKPHQLTALIEHLGRLRSKNLGYVILTKKLGNLVNETFLYGLDPEQFFKILKVYDTLEEHEFVKSFWTSLCARCIRPCYELPCLLCKLLRSTIPPEVAKAVASGLAEVTHSKEAVICSIQKLKFDRDNVNFAEFLDSLQLLEGTVLSEDEIFENMTGVISSMNPEEQCRLSCSLFRQKHSTILAWNTMRKIYEWLLEQVAVLGFDALNKLENETLLHGFAWFGSVALVKHVFSKLTATNMNETRKLSMVLETLKLDPFDSSAASSKFFKRETFNFLMLECIKSLARLGYKTSDCVSCFELMATSERSFIDSTKECVTSQWTVLAESLSFFETVEIVTAIFVGEIAHEGPCLKKFPHCWKIFTHLCNSVILKWDSEVVGKRLNENHIVSLMQIFFWIGEEKGINDFYRLVVDTLHSVEALADVHGAILRHKMTTELAMGSQQGILSLIDLIDTRIQTLVRRLAHLCPDDIGGGAYRKQSSSGNQQQIGEIPAPAALRLRAGTEMQSEIDEWQSLRRDILKRILAGQIKFTSTI